MIELEEHFADEVDEEAFEEHEDVDNIGDFAELVWQKRLEELDTDGRIMKLDCYKVDEDAVD